MPRVLIGSPVRRRPAILQAYLRGLEGLDLDGVQADFAFVDDCDDGEASRMLRAWRHPAGEPRVFVPEGVPAQEYRADNDFHRWGPELCRRVAAWRNHLADLCKVEGQDYLLLVDSDLVLQPQTLQCLLAAAKDIVYEVFWTRFYSSTTWHCPNVWLWGECGQYRTFPNEVKPHTQREIRRRSLEWFAELRVPGLYPVGGGGACTLVSRTALAAGVDWRPVPNLGWWGEDRFFQARASVLGFEQWADTHCPPVHLYRDGDLRALPLRTAGWRRGVAAGVHA